MMIRGLNFCINYSLALICTFLLVFLIDFLPGLSPGYASLLVLPLLIVSTEEGKSFARLKRARPHGGQSLVASLQMMVLALVTATFFFILGKHVTPILIAELRLPSINNSWVTIAAMVGGAVAVLRAGYAFGLASELKGQQFSG